MSLAAESIKVLLASDEWEKTWLAAAQQLTLAAKRSRATAPRHAAIALLLADALTFTPMRGLERMGAATSLILGLRLLSEPFIPSDREREFVRSLLSAGWKLTAPFRASVFRDLAPDLTG